MRRALLALLLVLLFAACGASGQKATTPHPAGGNQEGLQLERVGAPTFAPGVLRVGDVVRCGPRGAAASVPARGESVIAVFDGLNSSTIEVDHKKSGVIVVRCSV
jgi:hypothetical protein